MIDRSKKRMTNIQYVISPRELFSQSLVEKHCYANFKWIKTDIYEYTNIS